MLRTPKSQVCLEGKTSYRSYVLRSIDAAMLSELAQPMKFLLADRDAAATPSSELPSVPQPAEQQARGGSVTRPRLTGRDFLKDTSFTFCMGANTDARRH